MKYITTAYITWWWTQFCDHISVQTSLIPFVIHQLPETKTTAHMFSSYQPKPVLHAGFGFIWREAQAVEACVWCGQRVLGSQRPINIQFRSQATKTINRQVFHWCPEEKKYPPLLLRHLFNNLQDAQISHWWSYLVKGMQRSQTFNNATFSIIMPGKSCI